MTASRNWQTWCDTCNEYVAVDHNGACPWCTGPVVKRLPPRPTDLYIGMTPEIFEAAAKAYVAGHGMHDIADALFDRTQYSSPRTFRNALRNAFRRNGITIRPLSKSATLRLKRRSYARLAGEEIGTRCSGITKAGAQCLRDAQSGKTVCVFHDPERRGELSASSLELRAKQRAQMVHWNPYAERVLAWRDEFGGRGWRSEAIRISGMPSGTFSSLLHAHQHGRDKYINRAAAAGLDRLLATDPHEAREARIARGEYTVRIPGQEIA